MLSDDIYIQFNIDKSKLKRDYIKYPLIKGTGSQNKGEMPYKEDLKYLYIELNLRRSFIEQYFQQCSRTIKLWCKHFNLHKSSENIHKNSIITNIVRYNYPNPFSNQDVKNKYKFTMEQRYGVTNPSLLPLFVEKRCQTLIKNKTIGKSKSEEEIYKLLCEKYGEVKRQYKSELYPFRCDFYIPSKDLYIEYQGFWTHGREPYNKNNPLHQEKIKLWESKDTPQYKKAINDWTMRDVLKRKTAKNNGLNWIEFFNMNEFMKWFKK